MSHYRVNWAASCVILENSIKLSFWCGPLIITVSTASSPPSSQNVRVAFGKGACFCASFNLQNYIITIKLSAELGGASVIMNAAYELSSAVKNDGIGAGGAVNPVAVSKTLPLSRYYLNNIVPKRNKIGPLRPPISPCFDVWVLRIDSPQSSRPVFCWRLSHASHRLSVTR